LVRDVEQRFPGLKKTMVTVWAKCKAGQAVDLISAVQRGWARRIYVKVKEMKSIIEAYSQRSIAELLQP